MAVGLHLDYARSDECHLALQLVRAIEHLGHEISILPTAIRPPAVHPYWDTRLLRNYKHDFVDWCRGHSHIVFNMPPPLPYLDAVKQSGAKSVYLCLWNYIGETDAGVIPNFDLVICPAKVVYRHMKEAKLAANCKVLPWDSGAPITCSGHQVDPSRLGLFWSLDGSQPLTQDMGFGHVIESLLKLPFVYVTAAYTSRISDAGMNMLKHLVQVSDGRMELLRNAPYEKLLLTMASHDLTLWPSLIEDAGLVGLMSTAVGTPCIAYDHPVIAEVIKDGFNGNLVPCELDFNFFGVPQVVANYETYLNAVIKLLNNPEHIQALRTSVHYKLNSRRLIFNDGISALFNS